MRYSLNLTGNVLTVTFPDSSLTISVDLSSLVGSFRTERSTRRVHIPTLGLHMELNVEEILQTAFNADDALPHLLNSLKESIKREVSATSGATTEG